MKKWKKLKKTQVVRTMATKLKTDVFSVFYRVTHNGWDCKDDWKLSKYDDFSVELNLLPWI